MDITFGVIMTKDFPDSHSNAVRKIDNVLSKGLPDFKSDLIEKISIRFVCVSPGFSKFFKQSRPKYYDDKIVKIPGSITPEVRMYKCLTVDFFMDF